MELTMLVCSCYSISCRLTSVMLGRLLERRQNLLFPHIHASHNTPIFLRLLRNLNPLPLRTLKNIPPHLRIWCQLNRQPSFTIFLLPLGPLAKQKNSRIPMPFTNRMVQTRQPIYIPSIDGTPTLQQQSQHGHTPNRGRPMQRQLASPITHSRTRLIFLDQGPRNIEIVFGGTEVQ